MIKRIITVLVALPIAVLLTYAGGQPFALLLAVLGVLAIYEGRNLLLANEIHFSRLNYLFPVAYLGAILLGLEDMALQVVVSGAVVVLTRQLLDFPKFNLVSAGANLLIILYPTLLLGNMLLLRLHAGWAWTIIPLVAVWVYDAAAYVFGVRFGRIRMWTSVSPKKSLEGAMAGLVCSLFVILYMRSHLNIGLVPAFFLGLVIASAAHLGDLVESALKRYARVKDSGALFPGHGGVLDRLDSMMYASAVVYWLWSATTGIA
ncbi:MAG: phosphatidate cytidylyltransferase [Peptococcaceae bacterium]|nr:phosphatidate cytidylyltransferase [Peptococcaceae bacterium]